MRYACSFFLSNIKNLSLLSVFQCRRDKKKVFFSSGAKTSIVDQKIIKVCSLGKQITTMNGSKIAIANATKTVTGSLPVGNILFFFFFFLFPLLFLLVNYLHSYLN